MLLRVGAQRIAAHATRQPIRSFAAPVAVALCGGIVGLMMLSQGWALCFPYSLISLAMSADEPRAALGAATHTGFPVSSAAFAFGFSALGAHQLGRMELANPAKQ